MAESLPDKIIPLKATEITIGKKLLETITSGMYSNPHMIIREYIQNAVDSIDKVMSVRTSCS